MCTVVLDTFCFRLSVVLFLKFKLQEQIFVYYENMNVDSVILNYQAITRFSPRGSRMCFTLIIEA